MTGGPAKGSARRIRVGSVLFTALWMLSTLVSHWVGIWWAVGTSAAVLGLASVVIDPGLVARVRPTPRLIAAGLVAGGLMIAVTYLVYPLIRSAMPEVVVETGALYATFGERRGWVVYLLLPLVIVAEEILWRGLIHDALDGSGLPGWSQPLLAAGVYVLSVAPIGSPLLMIIALGCGTYWSLLRSASGSLLPPLLAHLLWDACVFVLFPLG